MKTKSAILTAAGFLADALCNPLAWATAAIVVGGAIAGQ